MSIPTKTEQYLMQIAYEIRISNQKVKTDANLTLDTFKLKYRDPDEVKTPEQQQRDLEISKAIWKARVKASQPPIKKPRR